MKYYHGGYGELKVGQYVLPPLLTRAATTANYGASSVLDRSKVYVCTQFEGALLFACGHHSGRGKVYEVEPMGGLEPDPDADRPNFSFQCQRAKVLKVYRVKGKTIKRVQKVLMEDCR